MNIACRCCCCAVQEAKDLLEKFVIGAVKAGTAKAQKQQAVSVTDLAAAAAADPSQPKVSHLGGEPVDTFTAERYSPHQITWHNSKVQIFF
jgi:hypothetical protein